MTCGELALADDARFCVGCGAPLPLPGTEPSDPIEERPPDLVFLPAEARMIRSKVPPADDVLSPRVLWAGIAVLALILLVLMLVA